MSKKIKRIFIIFLIVLVTALCIALGIKSRYDSRIKITQFKQNNNKSMGYMLKTNQNKIVMIDGGTLENSGHIADVLRNNGKTVDYWYITNIKKENFGVLKEILTSHTDITINNIVVSLNDDEWYRVNDSENFESIQSFLNILRTENVAKKVHIAELREEIKIDNLNIKVLKTANAENTNNNEDTQKMIIKVNNMFKSILFIGNANENIEDFVNHNLDEIECEAIQVLNSNINGLLLKKSKAKICFLEDENSKNLNFDEIYISNKENYAEIW